MFRISVPVRLENGEDILTPEALVMIQAIKDNCRSLLQVVHTLASAYGPGGVISKSLHNRARRLVKREKRVDGYQYRLVRTAP